MKADIAQRIDGTAGGRRVRAWARLLGIACAALAGAAYALLVGQDLNWDLFNYHRYNLHALIIGSFLEDVAPAGLQSFFNPIIYLPHYLLHRSLPPALAGAVLGGIQGLNIVLVWMLAGQLLRGSGGLPLQVMATALGVTGAVTLSEIGTSFADVLTSLPVLLALLLILRSSADHSQSRLLSAGLLIGMAVGLKLTNSIYTVGALAAVSVAARPLPRTLRLGTGVALGGLLTGGPWALFLWREYGSPTFPLYNGMFHAPDGPDSNLVEARFLPTDLADALFYPFYALIGDHRTTEVAHRDGRFALLAVLALAALAAHLWRRGEGERQATAPQSQVGRPYASFMLVSYLLWLALFGIQRYAVVLEMLAGLAIVALLDSLLADRRKRLIVAAVVVASIAWMQPADWGHHKWSRAYAGPSLPEALNEPAAVFLAGQPLAYLALYLHPQSRLYQLASNGTTIRPGGRFERQIQAGLERAWPGGIWLVYFTREPPDQAIIDLLERYDLEVDRDPVACGQVEGERLYGKAVACRLQHR